MVIFGVVRWWWIRCVEMRWSNMVLSDGVLWCGEM